MTAAPVFHAVARVDARLLAGTSPVEAGNAGAIEAVWREAHARKPKMFNGRILLGESVAIEDGVFRVDFRECAFATLIWLRSRPHDPIPLFNVFGAAAVVSRDGAALLGRMAPHTANAGQVYFPCGTPDLGDVRGTEVDLLGSIARELAEETGLAEPVARASDTLVAVLDGPVAALVRRYDSDLDAADLAALGARHLASETEPELDRIVMARAGERLEGEMPRATRAALSTLLGS